MSGTDLALSLLTLAGIAFAVLIAVRHHRMRTRDADLLTSGLPASASVVSVRPDEAEDDCVHLVIELDPSIVPPGQPAPPSRLEVTAFIPAIAFPSVQPGSIIRVRYDAAQPSRMILDLRAMGFQ